jgi:CRISPR-associated endonuclease/helicase Cas3
VNYLANLLYYLDRVLETFQEREDRPFLNFATQRAEENRISVIEAPTGYGKSAISQAIALKSLEEGLKCVVTFPLRTLLEDQLSKFRGTLHKLGLDERNVGTRYMHHADSRYLIRPITLTTVDTLSLTLFGIAPEDFEFAVKHYDGTLTRSMGHYLFSRAMVLLSDVVLDEVHLLSDTTKSLNFLIALIRIIASHGGRAVFMSATIPKALENILRREGEEVGLHITRFSEKPDDKFLEERRGKKYETNLEKLENNKFERILSWIKGGRRDGFRKSLVVFNTVPEAIEFYKIARESLDMPKDRMLLLHSRFTGDDREEKRKKIEKLRHDEEYLIVSTQVIEAGVDISSNLFVSDLAPASSLIQRLGRFLRYKEEKEGRVHLWYEDEKGKKYKGVYDMDLFRRTLSFLEGNEVRFHDPESYQPLLDSVYDEDSFNPKDRDIRKLIFIPTILESADLAVKTFIDLEGSFVRDSTLVPVISSSLWHEDMPLSELEKFLVPMSLSTVYEVKPKEMLVIEGDKISKKSTEELWHRKKEDVLKHVLSSKFVTFIVEGDYDEELGLVIRHEKDF